MRIRFIVLALFVALASLSLFAQSATSESPNTSKFVGVWRGQMDGLPGVEIGICNEGGEFRGAILFHLHIRPDTKSPWTSKSGPPGPMFNMKLDGDTLRFRVSHKGAHPPGSLNDPPVSFRLALSAPGTAALVNEEEGGPGLIMKRSDY